jgi:hypothetical protein
VTYVRSGPADAAADSSYEGSAEPVATALALSQARAYGADDDLAFAGTETFDGVPVDRYELRAANEALILAGSAAAANAPGDLRITSFEYVVLVDGARRHVGEPWRQPAGDHGSRHAGTCPIASTERPKSAATTSRRWTSAPRSTATPTPTPRTQGLLFCCCNGRY